jgi:hypothetical protein
MCSPGSDPADRPASGPDRDNIEYRIFPSTVFRSSPFTLSALHLLLSLFFYFPPKIGAFLVLSTTMRIQFLIFELIG